MTQPDGLFPNDAANSLSFTDYQQMSAFDWKEILRGEVQERLEWPEFGFNWNKETITEHTEAITNLQNVSAAMPTTVAYLGDEQQMVSVPRSQLSIGTISGSSTPPKSRIIRDSVEFVGSGVYHHSVMPVIRPAVTIGSTTGDIIYTPIIADRRGQVEGIAWVGGADTSIFSIDFYEVSLCILNPLTGNVEKAWTSGNIKDGAASTTTLDELFMSIGTPQVCTPGQILFAAHQQTAPGLLQTARTIGAVPQANIGRSSAERLKAWCYRAPAYSQGIPSSISFASLTLENWYVPFFGLRVGAIIEEEEGS